MGDVRCEVTDLIKDQCAHCLGVKSIEEEIRDEQNDEAELWASSRLLRHTT